MRKCKGQLGDYMVFYKRMGEDAFSSLVAVTLEKGYYWKFGIACYISNKKGYYSIKDMMRFNIAEAGRMRRLNRNDVVLDTAWSKFPELRMCFQFIIGGNDDTDDERDRKQLLGNILYEIYRDLYNGDFEVPETLGEFKFVDNMNQRVPRHTLQNPSEYVR